MDWQPSSPDGGRAFGIRKHKEFQLILPPTFRRSEEYLARASSELVVAVK